MSIQQTIRIEEVAQHVLQRTLMTPIEEVIRQVERCNLLQEREQRTEYNLLQEREAIVQVREVAVLLEAETMFRLLRDLLTIRIHRLDLILVQHPLSEAPAVLQPDQRRQEFLQAHQDVAADRNSEF